MLQVQGGKVLNPPLEMPKTVQGIHQLNTVQEKIVFRFNGCCQIQRNISKYYAPDQIYNCDESIFNLEILLSKTLTLRKNVAQGYNHSKERIAQFFNASCDT